MEQDISEARPSSSAFQVLHSSASFTTVATNFWVMECSWAWYIIIAYPCVVTAPSATIIEHETGTKLGSEGISCSFSLLTPYQITTRMSGLLDLL